MSRSPEFDRPDRQKVGDCPHCGTRLGRGDVLISYIEDERRRHWADCPDCREVVHPQRP
ncbi:DUF7837 family putative zinc-binding protein [Haloarchaeobius baliensis]|uniref:DUF7837 family putative zinc-binding protein n=1 Tax=Haloarchaeobius baliensis TaxID=1670458 RepID=UPI003F8834DD